MAIKEIHGRILEPICHTKALFDPLRFSDRDLSQTLAACRREAARRSQAASMGLDAGAVIKGQEFAKRAIAVAASGGHSVCLYGGPGVGKTMLRALALAVGVDAAFEVRPCPCGWLGHLDRVCRCMPARIAAWRRRNRVEADIYVEVLTTPQCDMNSPYPGTTAADIDRQTARTKANCRPEGGNLDAEHMFRAIAEHLGIDHAEMASIRAVTETVARMDGAAAIESRHVAEACGYRRPSDW